jgi:hypothetical protein
MFPATRAVPNDWRRVRGRNFSTEPTVRPSRADCREAMGKDSVSEARAA